MKRIRYDYRVQSPENVIALKRDNFKCVQCGSEDNIIVHHKDETRKLGIKKLNRSLDNLLTLCRSCHAKVHNQNLRFINPNISLIRELRQNGKTYEEIGNYIGISRQRVHQIVAKFGVLTPDTINDILFHS